jgi:DNA processing protein
LLESFEKENVISPYNELISYETLWTRQGATIKKISEYLEGKDLASEADFSLLELEEKEKIKNYFENNSIDFSIITAKSFQYPEKLKDPKYPIKLLYYKGNFDLLETPKRISIVGARKATEIGLKRAAKLAQLLTKKGYVIVSGLAKGIDTAAMTKAIENGGKVVGVIGTPITKYYPKENKPLQDLVAKEHLLISHVPIYRYEYENFNTKRFYFPQRNVTMAALSQATVIVEASDTSGTLTQARACMEMGRPLFILNSCFENPNIKWPHTYEKRGAIRVREIEDILKVLEVQNEQ